MWRGQVRRTPSVKGNPGWVPQVIIEVWPGVAWGIALFMELHIDIRPRSAARMMLGLVCLTPKI